MRARMDAVGEDNEESKRAKQIKQSWPDVADTWRARARELYRRKLLVGPTPRTLLEGTRTGTQCPRRWLMDGTRGGSSTVPSLYVAREQAAGERQTRGRNAAPGGYCSGTAAA